MLNRGRIQLYVNEKSNGQAQQGGSRFLFRRAFQVGNTEGLCRATLTMCTLGGTCTKYVMIIFKAMRISAW